jgi:hypothetical protein
MLTTRNSGSTTTSASSHFMFATIFISLWPLFNRVFLLGSLLFAAWGAVILYQQYRRTPAQHRKGVMRDGVIAALVFVVAAQIVVGYNVGKHMALQDSAACSVVAQAAPNNSFQRTRCARR